MNKRLLIGKKETRFLLNFVLDESNAFFGGEKKISQININNCKSISHYRKKLETLKKRLLKLDKSFYK